MDNEILKTSVDGLEVEYEIIYPQQKENENSFRAEIHSAIDVIDSEIDSVQLQIDELNSKIDSLTNHADGADYAISVTCGIVTGLIDSFFVGKWDFANAKAISNEKINKKVMDFAKSKGCTGNRLQDAIDFLEKKYPLPGDGAYKPYKGDWGITDSTHHLDDLCHHPTIVGLIACIAVQFTGSIKYSSHSGGLTESIPITVNEYGNIVGKNEITKLFAGVVNWFFTVAKTMANRKGHLMSDMAGSYSSSKKGNSGMGIPGSFMSTLKELSALPCFKDTNFGENLRKAFQNGIGSGKSQLDLGVFNSLFEGASSKFDMRTEMAVGHELKRQALPVIINEVLVRASYFIRRLIGELKIRKSILDVNWKAVIPFNNRTIVRMLTIATGTFTAVDLIDAAARAVIETGGLNPATAAKFILRVNFVGVGRFAIACTADIGMGISKSVKEKQVRVLMTQKLLLLNAKVFYKDADMWISAKEAGESIERAAITASKSVEFFLLNWNGIKQDLAEIPSMIPKIEEKNPGLLDELLNIFEEDF